MNQESKKRLKTSLIYSSIILGLIFTALLLYGLFFEVPIAYEVEKSLNQIQIVDITKIKENTLTSIDEEKDLDAGLKELSPNQEKSDANQPKTTKDESVSEDNKSKQVNLQDDEDDKKIQEKNKSRPAGQKSKLTILVTNLGTSKELTESAINLNKNFTLGFSAFTTSLKRYFIQALDRRFEVFIYLPFEPKDYPISDPGPYAMLTRYETLKNLNIMKSILSEFNGSKGVYGNTREIFTSNKEAFLPLLKSIDDRNMSIIIGNTSQKGHNSFMQEYKNFINADIIIDMIADENVIKNNLKKLELLALERGDAVGYVNTYPITLKILAEWQKTLEEKGIELTPATKLIKSRN